MASTPARGRRGRRRAGPPRCEHCHRPVVLLTNPHLGRGTTAFDDRTVDGRTWTGGEAHPVENLRAWRLRDLVEDLMVRRGVSRADAETEAYAMPWKPVHRCASIDERRPTTPDPRGDQNR